LERSHIKHYRHACLPELDQTSEY